MNCNCLTGIWEFKMIRRLHFVVLLSAGLVNCSSFIQECLTSSGVEYRGTQQKSSSGNICLNWNNVSRDYDVTSHADSDSGVGDHIFCRNPDGSDRPWCYVSTTDGRTLREACAIDPCQDQAITVTSLAGPDPSPRSSSEAFELAKPPSVRAEDAVVQPVMGVSQRVRFAPKKKKDLGTMGRYCDEDYCGWLPKSTTPNLFCYGRGTGCVLILKLKLVQGGVKKRFDQSLGLKLCSELPSLLSLLCTLTGYVLAVLMMAIIILLGVGITVGYFYKRGRDLKKKHEQRAYEREMHRITLPLSAFANPTCELVDENAVVVVAESGEQTPGQGTVEGGGEPLIGPAGTPGA
uniref:Kringle domain-containing protein n=1 Tax=Electrophorus electricus TaxID=8005 RepID=A0A4W4HBS3_ELEEL